MDNGGQALSAYNLVITEVSSSDTRPVNNLAGTDTSYMFTDEEMMFLAENETYRYVCMCVCVYHMSWGKKKVERPDVRGPTSFENERRVVPAVSGQKGVGSAM